MSLISNHLSFAKLVDLAEGRSLPDAIKEHLSDCSSCATTLTRLEELLQIMRQDRMEDAPPELIARAVALFGARAASTEPSLVRRIVAALRFDSLQMTPAYGVRSGGAGARQLLYNAGENDLDLRLTRSDEAWVISGQVLGPDCMSAEIELKGEASETQQQAVLNDQCEFRLSPVPPGSYSLRLRLVDREVEIPQLELRT